MRTPLNKRSQLRETDSPLGRPRRKWSLGPPPSTRENLHFDKVPMGP